MKITICGSSTFRKEMIKYRDKLNEMGHEGITHPVYEKLVNGEMPELMHRIETEHAEVKKENDFIKWYYNSIINSDAILVLNFDKNGIKNYIGGNTLMEIAFAHVHDKKVFLLNPVPEIGYKDEILAMYSLILEDNLNKIT
jgi:hypothetical protein